METAGVHGGVSKIHYRRLFQCKEWCLLLFVSDSECPVQAVSRLVNALGPFVRFGTCEAQRTFNPSAILRESNVCKCNR